LCPTHLTASSLMLDQTPKASEIRKKMKEVFGNLPAYLIAGNRSQNETGQEIKSPVLSLDRVTMMLRTREYDQTEIDFSRITEKIESRFEKRIAVLKNPRYHCSFMYSHEGTEINICYSPSFSQETRYGFRMEFNPNKVDFKQVSEFLCEIVGYLAKVEMKDFIKFNRLDIAIDLPIDLNPNLITVPGSQKSFIVSGSNGIESIYFGHRSSDFFLRVYNKKKELLKKQKIDYEGKHLWRIELELKKEFKLEQSYAFIKDYFTKINFFNCCERTGDWKLDLIIFKSIQEGYDINVVLKELPKCTRIAYKKKLNRYNHKNVLNINGIVSRQLSKVFGDFKKQILKSCEASPF
jgi:hypothetical protein